MDGGIVSGNQWTEERLARAALGTLLRYGAMSVLELAARLGPQAAWQLLHGGDAEIEAQIGQPPPGTNGQSFRAWAAAVDPEQIACQTDKCGLRFIMPGDAEWPEKLIDLAHCDIDRQGGVPVGLWVAGPGHLTQWCEKAVAVVGSRASTRYGESVALQWASELAAADEGWTIVSGGAFGIDAASHRGALVAGGRTVGLFANGLDVSYPPGNAALIEGIKQNGLVVSELPPGSNPTRQGFLARNRLIAALSAGTIVVEAAARSGARNTASWAAALGRVLMAVPGPVTSALSETPHRLIRDSLATLVSNSADVCALLAPLGFGPQLPIGGPDRRGDELSGDLAVVREALPGRGGFSINEVALASGVPVQRCIEALGRLADLGYASANEVGRWRARHPDTD